MEKKIWTKPGINIVAFAANEYISSCTAAYSGTLYCALPNDPNKIDDYTYQAEQVFREPSGWLGMDMTANHGSCDDPSSFSFVGNHSSGEESVTGASIWDVQIGDEVTDPYNTSLGYQWPGLDIGETTYFDETSEGKWYKAIWRSGGGNGGVWSHFGLANITDVTVAGNPNHS